MADFTIKQNDLLPPLIAQLLNADNTPYQIPVGSSIRLQVRAENLQSGNQISSTSVAVTNALLGQVQYNWVLGDTSVPGVFNIEFEVTLTNSKRITFPNYGYRTLEIVADLS